jgi:hypothetical protein
MYRKYPDGVVVHQQIRLQKAAAAACLAFPAGDRLCIDDGKPGKQHDAIAPGVPVYLIAGKIVVGIIAFTADAVYMLFFAGLLVCIKLL